MFYIFKSTSLYFLYPVILVWSYCFEIFDYNEERYVTVIGFIKTRWSIARQAVKEWLLDRDSIGKKKGEVDSSMQKKTGHAGGELNATSHVTAHRLLKMGSFKLWEIVKTNLNRDWDFTINMKSLCHYLGDGGTEKDS